MRLEGKTGKEERQGKRKEGKKKSYRSRWRRDGIYSQIVVPLRGRKVRLREFKRLKEYKRLGLVFRCAEEDL